MFTKIAKIATFTAVAAIISIAPAQAGKIKGSPGVGNGSDQSVSGKGKVHINQNGNGCRNRCYIVGGTAFNAGYNNGNTVDISNDTASNNRTYRRGKRLGYGKRKGYGRW